MAVEYPTCHNAHHDTRRAESGEPCGAPLGAVPGPLTFVETRAHFTADGRTYLRCPTRGCGAWNVFTTGGEDMSGGGGA